MGIVLFDVAKLLIQATAVAAAALIVGGAVKMLIEEDGETCLRTGLEVAGAATGAARLAAGLSRLPELPG